MKIDYIDYPTMAGCLIGAIRMVAVRNDIPEEVRIYLKEAEEEAREEGRKAYKRKEEENGK